MSGKIKGSISALVLFLLPEIIFAADGSVIDTGSTSWMLISTALVLLMMPGLAMFYGGLVRSKNVLGTMMHTFVAMAVIGVLWVICGYSLTFGKNILGGFIGWNPDFFFLKGIDEVITGGIPEYIVAMFQGKFAIITPALISGAMAERVYLRGYIMFIALWFLVVYCPLCHWVWASEGWLFNTGAAGVIDLAGGLVIHVSAGVSALVVAIFLGPRLGYQKLAAPPNNLVMTLMGAGLLWVGWFGFNAGSTLQSGLDTARALTMTQISAATGALTWLCIEGIIYRKASALGFASGTLAGLVVITPAAAVVLPVGAFFLGAVSSIGCFYAVQMKNKLGYDDALDCFGIHGVGSGLGVILLSFFIRDSWLANASKAAGRAWTSFDQLFVQLKGLGATISIAVIATVLLCILVEKTVGFRMDPENEYIGMDQSLHGERGYDFS
ncbi:MAG: ammonia channel protein [Desulfobacula sp. RIFOXYA12_FULL_46_16]|nr:MAG: ammonia channel protein [Desulfobacula sp. RIFOXYA12_FULL_46_16]